jgi:IS30 family transposase
LKRSKSAIAEEWKVNAVKGIYDPAKAQQKSYVRRRNAKYQGKKIVQHLQLRKFVEDKLMDDQSPQAIAGRIRKQEKHLPSVSKESIYRYIQSPYGRNIEIYRQQKRQRKRSRRAKLKKLDGRVFIDKRPQHINKRVSGGHAEADFIVSGKSGHGILVVVVDRKLRTAFLEQILIVSVQKVHKAFLRILKRYPEMKSFTTDNDILFRHHKKLEKLLGIKIYFCHPYHSWEKGAVENVNKYIRKDIPKGSDLSRYSKKLIASLEEKLNRRAMKCLDYATPQEMLHAFRKRKISRKKNLERKSGCPD